MPRLFPFGWVVQIAAPSQVGGRNWVSTMPNFTVCKHVYGRYEPSTYIISNGFKWVFNDIALVALIRVDPTH